MAYEGWIPDLLGIKTVRHNGGPVYPSRATLDFQGDVSITDDVVNNKLIVSIALQNNNDAFEAYKSPARVATTANITLSGLLTIDGVTLNNGDRVLVKNQSAGAENGVYIAAATAWSRATDFDATAEVESGLMIVVSEGTTNADSVWQLATNNPITLGVSALVFAQVGSSSATALRGVNLDPATISAPSTSDVISYDGTKYVAAKITNAMINAAAAIAVAKLAAGANGQFLRTTAGVPVWATLSSSDIGENVITPATLNSQADNFSPSGFSDATVVRIASSGNLDLTGLDATAALKRKTIVNVGANRITLKHASGSSAAANQFETPTGLDWPLAAGESALVLYDSTTSRWRVLGTWGLSAAHTWLAAHAFNAGLSATTGSFSGALAASSLSTTNAVVAGTGVTATNGNITAANGNVSASGSVTGAAGVTASSGNVSAPAGNLSAGGIVDSTGNVVTGTGQFTYSPPRTRTSHIPMCTGFQAIGAWTYTRGNDAWSIAVAAPSPSARLVFPMRLPFGSVITGWKFGMRVQGNEDIATAARVDLKVFTPDYSIDPNTSYSAIATTSGTPSSTGTMTAPYGQIVTTTGQNISVDPSAYTYDLVVIPAGFNNASTFELLWLRVDWTQAYVHQNLT